MCHVTLAKPLPHVPLRGECDTPVTWGLWGTMSQCPHPAGWHSLIQGQFLQKWESLLKALLAHFSAHFYYGLFTTEHLAK